MTLAECKEISSIEDALCLMSPPLLSSYLEKILVDLSDVKRILNPTPDIVTDHEAVSCSPSISTIRLLRKSAVSLAEEENAEVVTNRPFAAL